MDLSVSQAAKQLNVSTKTIYRRIQSGELPVQRISPTCLRIDENDFQAFRASLKARKPYERKQAV